MMLQPDGMYWLMSAMNKMNRIGPRTLPWMTPASTLFHSVATLPTFTHCVLSLRYAAIHRQSQVGSSLSTFVGMVDKVKRFGEVEEDGSDCFPLVFRYRLIVVHLGALVRMRSRHLSPLVKCLLSWCTRSELSKGETLAPLKSPATKISGLLLRLPLTRAFSIASLSRCLTLPASFKLGNVETITSGKPRGSLCGLVDKGAFIDC